MKRQITLAAVLTAAALLGGVSSVPVFGENNETRPESRSTVSEEYGDSEGMRTDSLVPEEELDSVISEAEQEEFKDTIESHVSGIKDFSVIQGMAPDVMLGISWDETIEAVEPDLSSVDWMRPGIVLIRFMITSSDGLKAMTTARVTIEPDLDFYLYGMEGEAVTQVGEPFDAMKGITWSSEISTVTADLSEVDYEKPGSYLINYTLTTKEGRTQNTVRQLIVSDGTYDPVRGFAGAEGSYSTVQDLGLWRLTAYMDTPADQGIYVGQTASGAPLVAGRTVAVSSATMSRYGLSFGDRLMIDGHIYVLEDHGGSAMHNQDWVDIFVDNPGDEYSERFNRYSEVYLLR